MASITLTTDRLHLTAADLDLALAELAGCAALALQLGCKVPSDWPPPLNDDDSLQFFLGYLREHTDAAGWVIWYITTQGQDGEELVGAAGFKGKPASDGTVEIGYSILPIAQRRGYASEAVAALTGWAFERGATRVIAHTFPDLLGSIGVLGRNGFTLVGAGAEPGTILFERLPAGGAAGAV